MKELIERSFKMGYAAYPQQSAPYLNKDFMEILPNYEWWDEKAYKLRVKLYKSYAKGWTQANLDEWMNEHLDKVCNVN